MEYKWKKGSVEKFIFYIQENPCLYNERSKEYMDRPKKALVYNEICKKMQEDMAGVTVADIKKKWKSLRTQYLRETRLISDSKKSGKKLWCFDQLAFLQTHCIRRESQDNTEASFNKFAKTKTSQSAMQCTTTMPSNGSLKILEPVLKCENLTSSDLSENSSTAPDKSSTPQYAPICTRTTASGRKRHQGETQDNRYENNLEQAPNVMKSATTNDMWGEIGNFVAMNGREWSKTNTELAKQLKTQVYKIIYELQQRETEDCILLDSTDLN